MFAIETEIEDDLIDDLYNHVHHGRCFYLLERGRLALMEVIGQPNDMWLKRGIALVITNVNVQYKRELKRGPITITCDTGRVEGKRIVVEQRILNSRGKIAVQGSIESAFMSIQDRRGIDVPEEFWASFEAWVLRQNLEKAQFQNGGKPAPHSLTV